MASKHGSKSKRNKKHQPKAKDAVAAFRCIRSNLRAHFTGTMETAVSAPLRANFRKQMDDEQQKDLSLEYRSAFVALMHGGGDTDDWDTIVSALNVALVLAERGFGEEFQPALIDALDHIFAAKLHHDKTRTWAIGDDAAKAINEGLDVHAAQLEHTMQADVMSALAEVAKRIELGQVYKEAA